MTLSLLQQQIINSYQKGFPVCSRPYQVVATALNSTEDDVISAIKDLKDKNILSRLGPVFCHKKAGASTLAAIAVPPAQLDKVAGIVNQFEQVNHNYAREHEYNLWFVVTANDAVALEYTLMEIELLTGLPVLVLPMEAAYHIDLGFNIDFQQSKMKEH
ncbi:Lrp/AsnC family transcriptional regulator [Thalassotalea atypica]|uniref:Lrp/AsnC family transcriptional regulator n=1 Tax=Thalassotalea atypica TaxID=2054316 RepID=UPI00257395C2|nr:Lrp/AsnC family transcriptional regulator [Thalassotalea atypica]